MKNLDPFIVGENESIKDAILQIENNNCRCVIVIKSRARRIVTGVFSQGDVLRALLDGVDVLAPLNRVLSPTFKYLKSRDMDKALEYIRDGLTLVPVVDQTYALKDVITFFDVINERPGDHKVPAPGS